MKTAVAFATLIVAALLLCGCGSSGSSPSQGDTLADAITRADLLVSTFDVSSIERCDKLTFVGMFAGLGSRAAQEWIPGAEWGEPGQLNRDHEACDSVIPFSRDALMGYMWSLTAQNDPYMTSSEQLAHRVWDRLERLDWVDRGTDMWPLRGLMQRQLSLTEPDDSAAVASFQEHLVAYYCHLRARAWGSLGVTCSAAVAVLARQYPANPWFLALDGQQDAALAALEQVPDEGSAATGWGSCPNSLIIALTVDAIERVGM